MALALLLVPAALSQMDVPTRSSYVMAVVTPAGGPPLRASRGAAQPSRGRKSAMPARSTPLVSVLPLDLRQLKITYDRCFSGSSERWGTPEEQL